MSKLATVGIDASRAFVSRRTGTENYTWQLIKALATVNCRYNFCLYTRPSSIDLTVSLPTSFLEQFSVRRINWPRFWTQLGLAIETWQHPPDLLFVPAHVVPFFKKPSVPVVVTVHDLRSEFLPQHESWLQRFYLNRLTEWLRARLATQIIAVSQATKRDILNKLAVPESKITVIYEGVNRQRFSPLVKEQFSQITRVRKKYALEGRYILFVGTVQPRKNLLRLIKAFAGVLGLLPPKQAQDLHLVIAGGKGWQSQEIYAAPQALGLKNKVHFIGYVPERDLPFIYAGAEIFVLPSLYEGFGLPVLEAMAVGVPVLTSKVAALPEVAGKAAYYLNPESVSSIVDALGDILTHSSLRGRMVREGYQQVKKFSWVRAAQQTCAVFEAVLSGTTRKR